jgi:hypothetical protein
MSIAPRCHEHPRESATSCFSCYLSKPCDQEGCDAQATHNGVQRGSAGLVRGRWCNAHTSWDHPAFARND